MSIEKIEEITNEELQNAGVLNADGDPFDVDTAPDGEESKDDGDSKPTTDENTDTSGSSDSPDASEDTPEESDDELESTEEEEESAEEGDTDESDSEEEKPEDYDGPTYEDAKGNKYRGDTTFKTKIDGEIREVPLKDAIDQYSVNFAADARFAEVNKIKQKSEHQVYTANRMATRWIDAMQKGDTWGALDIFCEFTGKDSATIRPQILEAQKQLLEQLSEVGPEGWDAYAAKSEADYIKAREKNREEAVTENEVWTKKADAQNQFGLNENHFTVAAQIVLDNKRKNGYNGELQATDMDQIIDTARDFKVYESIDSVVKEHLPEKQGNEQFYDTVFQDTRQYGVTPEKWLSIMKKASAKKSKVSKLAKKIEANQSPTKGKRSVKKTTKKSMYPKSKYGEKEDPGMDWDSV